MEVIMDKLKIELDDKKDVEGYVLLNLHKYNQQNCEYIKENSSYAHNNEINGDFIIYDNDKISENSAHDKTLRNLLLLRDL